MPELFALIKLSTLLIGLGYAVVLVVIVGIVFTEEFWGLLMIGAILAALYFLLFGTGLIEWG